MNQVQKKCSHSSCLILLNTQFVHKIFQIFVLQCSKDYYVNQMTKHRVLIYLYFLRTNASKSLGIQAILGRNITFFCTFGCCAEHKDRQKPATFTRQLLMFSSVNKSSFYKFNSIDVICISLAALQRAPVSSPTLLSWISASPALRMKTCTAREAERLQPTTGEASFPHTLPSHISL